MHAVRAEQKIIFFYKFGFKILGVGVPDAGRPRVGHYEAVDVGGEEPRPMWRRTNRHILRYGHCVVNSALCGTTVTK